jgi:hypothetical protein
LREQKSFLPRWFVFQRKGNYWFASLFLLSFHEDNNFTFAERIINVFSARFFTTFFLSRSRQLSTALNYLIFHFIVYIENPLIPFHRNALTLFAFLGGRGELAFADSARFLLFRPEMSTTKAEKNRNWSSFPPPFPRRVKNEFFGGWNQMHLIPEDLLLFHFFPPSFPPSRGTTHERASETSARENSFAFHDCHIHFLSSPSDMEKNY